MPATQIFGPFFGMLLLTLTVWVLLYARRITFLQKNKIHPQRLKTRERAAQLISEETNYPADNLMNLFELPVVFYALCIYLYVSGNVDFVYVAAAWAFFGLRAVHSAIHCTVNRVMARFLAYMAAALVLWFMVLRAALQL